MGSLQHLCRLCAIVVPEDQQVRIFNENEDNSLQSKLRTFLNLDLNIDNFSLITCQQCVSSLEFCIQVESKDALCFLIVVGLNGKIDKVLML